MTLANANMLTPTEAAVVSNVDLRDVNRVIDESILPADFYRVHPDRTRRLLAEACTFISFYFHAAGSLTAEERLRTIATASERMRKEPTSRLEKEWTVRARFLTIDLAPFLKRVHEKLSELGEARALVVEDPEVLGGTPVIRGTRIPVYDVAASVAAGLPASRILAAYPDLTAEMVELAAFYVTANPPRGRPREHSSRPLGASVVSTRRTPRRRRSRESAR